jgi:drug/metabolite transporter (DMT)-like permease
MVVLQPSGAGMGTASILALGSAGAYAGFLVLTRFSTRHEAVSVIVLWNSGLQIVCVALWMIPIWKTPTPHDWMLFSTIAVTGVIGQYATTAAYRLGEASLLAPLQYTSLIWAALFGYLIFGDVPTLTLWMGAAIIIAATLYVMQHEYRRK